MDYLRTYTDLRTGSMSFADFMAFLSTVRQQEGRPPSFAAAPLCEEQKERLFVVAANG